MSEPNQPVDLHDVDDLVQEFTSGRGVKNEILDEVLERDAGKITRAHLRLRTLAEELSLMFDKMPRTLTGQPGEEAVIVMISDRLSRKIANVLRAAARAKD